LKKTRNGCLLLVLVVLLTPICLILAFDRDTKPRSRVKQIMATANRGQSAFISEYGKFATNFDELAIGDLVDKNTNTSEKFEYKIDVSSKDLAIIGAKPIDRELYGFNGAVLRSKNKGVIETVSIVCHSQAPGADGTDPVNTPIADPAGKLRCANGWNDVLGETQSKQSK
jgi:Type IV pilin-like G and H, putative